MKAIEVHFYETPSRDNSGCPFSLGIMNMTRREAELVRSYAQTLRGQLERDSQSLPAPTAMSWPTLSAGKPARENDDAADAFRYLDVTANSATRIVRDNTYSAELRFDREQYERVERAMREKIEKEAQRAMMLGNEEMIDQKREWFTGDWDVRPKPRKYICDNGHQSNTMTNICQACAGEVALKPNPAYVAPLVPSTKPKNRFSELELPDEPKAE